MNQKRIPYRSGARSNWLEYRCALLAVILTICLAGSSAAERIKLKNGKTIDGIVQERRDGRVYILTSVGEFAIPEDQLVSVPDAGSGDSVVSRIRLHIQGGALLSAVEELQEYHSLYKPDAPRQQKSMREILQIFVRAQKDVSILLGHLSPSEIESVLGFFAEVLITVSPPQDAAVRQEHVYYHAFRVQLALWYAEFGLEGKIIPTLEPLQLKLPEAYNSLNIRAKQLLMNYLIDNLTKSQEEALVPVLEVIKKFDRQLAKAAQVWLVLSEVQKLRSSNNYWSALEKVETELLYEWPGVAAYKMLDLLSEVDIVFKRDKRFDELLELCDHFGLPHLGEKVHTPYRNLLESAGWNAINEGQPKKAEAYFTQIEQFDRGETSKLLVITEYHQRRQALNDDDLLGLYKLGVWCVEQGLGAQGRILLQLAEEDPALEELARMKMEVLDRTESTALFEKTTIAYEEERFADAMDHADEYLMRFQLGEMREQARQIKTNAAVELTNQLKKRPATAASLVDHAQRLFFTRDYRDSLKLLDRVLLEYGDTPAAERARILKRAVLRRIYDTNNREVYVKNTDTRKAPRAENRKFVIPGMPSARQADSFDNPELRNELYELEGLLAPYSFTN
jgi:hypothetical protein